MSKTLNELRAETPACENIIHLNNAGAALSPEIVNSTVKAHLELEQRIGGYEAELAKKDELAAVYRSLADLLACQPAEIAITQNATRAWDMVFYGLDLRPGDKILTCRSEYASNYIAFLQQQKKLGFEIALVDDDEYGALCLESLKAKLDEDVKLVAINHIPTNGGLVQPAEAIGEILRDHPCFYLLDACQSVGQIPIDVGRIGCDALSATGRKYLRGPRGVGFLYVNSQHFEKINPPFLDLHAATWTGSDSYRLRDDAKRFECYEVFLAGKLALGAAARYHLEVGPQWAWERLSDLANKARTGLAAIPGVQVHDLGRVKGGIVSFTVQNHDCQELRAELQKRGINVWTCSNRSARIDMDRRGLAMVLRASFHYYNTEAELELFLSELEKLIRQS